MKNPPLKSSPPKPGAQRTSAAPAVLTVSEFAELVGISPQHVIDLIDEGKLCAINVGGHMRHYWRIPREEADRFVQRRSSV